MSETRYTQLALALDELEMAMRQAQLWSAQAPSQEALQSTKPFCVDTLGFEQWVQFIMLPTFRGMIQNTQPLPKQCDIQPMASEMWKSQHQAVQACIRKVDLIITQ